MCFSTEYSELAGLLSTLRRSTVDKHFSVLCGMLVQNVSNM